jgi:hypothetical protein
MTHGTRSGYAKYGCRCPDCTAAQRARMREYRKRRTTTIPTDGGATSHGTTEIAPGAAVNDPGAGTEPSGGPDAA